MGALTTDEITGILTFRLTNKHYVGAALSFGRVESTHTSTGGYASKRVKISGSRLGKGFCRFCVLGVEGFLRVHAFTLRFSHCPVCNLRSFSQLANPPQHNKPVKPLRILSATYSRFPLCCKTLPELSRKARSSYFLLLSC